MDFDPKFTDEYTKLDPKFTLNSTRQIMHAKLDDVRGTYDLDREEMKSFFSTMIF